MHHWLAVPSEGSRASRVSVNVKSKHNELSKVVGSTQSNENGSRKREEVESITDKSHQNNEEQESCRGRMPDRGGVRPQTVLDNVRYTSKWGEESLGRPVVYVWLFEHSGYSWVTRQEIEKTGKPPGWYSRTKV